MVTPNEIRERLKAEPFQPFTLYSSDGKEYTIIHPEQAWVTRDSVFVTLPSSEAEDKLALPAFMKPIFEPPSYVTQVSVGNLTRMEINGGEHTEKPNMNLEALEELHNKRPFIPFRI